MRILADVDKLKYARLKAGLSVKELAKRVDVNETYLSSILNAKRGTSVQTASKIAKAVNESYLNLFSIHIEQKQKEVI
ncbi:helix-turn-helix transcriptional regulator [Macrococcus capreoli]|uniref:helix-turn-helix transcriptional regulator n=1 Tax=Macrococcus capreoli TaxID=2982690 RepID=UPI003F42891F